MLPKFLMPPFLIALARGGCSCSETCRYHANFYDHTPPPVLYFALECYWNVIGASPLIFSGGKQIQTALPPNKFKRHWRQTNIYTSRTCSFYTLALAGRISWTSVQIQHLPSLAVGRGDRVESSTVRPSYRVVATSESRIHFRPQARLQQ